MIDARMVVDMLSIADEVQAAEVRFSARLRDIDNEIIPDEPSAEVERGVTKPRVLPEADGEMARLVVPLVPVLDADVVGSRAIGHRQVDDGIGIEVRLSLGHLVFDKAGNASGRDIDVDANLGHAVVAGFVAYMDAERPLQCHILAYRDVQSIVEQRDIEIAQAAGRCEFGYGVTQAFDADTVWQAGD